MSESGHLQPSCAVPTDGSLSPDSFRAKRMLLTAESGHKAILHSLRSEALTDWFARPVLFVTDVDRSVDFYVNQLGFTQSWRYEEDGKALVAQVDRQGCALILSLQWRCAPPAPA